MVAYRESVLYQASADLPLPAMNLLLGAVIVPLAVMLWRRDRLQPHLSPEQ